MLLLAYFASTLTGSSLEIRNISRSGVISYCFHIRYYCFFLLLELDFKKWYLIHSLSYRTRDKNMCMAKCSLFSIKSMQSIKIYSSYVRINLVSNNDSSKAKIIWSTLRLDLIWFRQCKWLGKVRLMPKNGSEWSRSH